MKKKSCKLHQTFATLLLFGKSELSRKYFLPYP